MSDYLTREASIKNKRDIKELRLEVDRLNSIINNLSLRLDGIEQKSLSVRLVSDASYK